MTSLYSLLHLLVDGICAFSMFGRFLPHGNQTINFLLYNFCAFALQMPFGTILDFFIKQEKCSRTTKIPCFVAIIGVLFTLLGTFTHPILLGIGNALFHVGGGVGTIYEDHAKHWKGRGLGIFVAPGALGLYLGTLAAKNEIAQDWLWIICSIMLLCCAFAINQARKFLPFCYIEQSSASFDNSTFTMQNGTVSYNVYPQNSTQRNLAPLCVALCCLLVVILRSYVGMKVLFPWKTSIFSGVLAVMSIVFGKIAGGFLAARYGILKISITSLFFAAIAYLCSDIMLFGIIALFLFNMTMPITLYLMVCLFLRMPGFSFGFLTFGLFLGFLPAYFGFPTIISGNLIGCVGSVLSMLLLYASLHTTSCSI